jgi:hypothetical protein
VVVALVDVNYLEPELGCALVDAVLAVDVASGLLVPTANGSPFFSYWRELGTLSDDPADSVYKIQVGEGERKRERGGGGGEGTEWGVGMWRVAEEVVG